MTKAAPAKSMVVQKMKKKKKYIKPEQTKIVRRLQKQRPKRYMNAFLCFAHEERMKAQRGTLLVNWRAAHKGLGA